MKVLSVLERLAYERRRARSVAEIFSAALQQRGGGDPVPVAFYLALVDYLEVAMHRLHIQGVRMVDIIHDKLEAPDPEVREALCDVERCLVDNQRLLAALGRVRERFAQEDAAVVGEFEQIGREFSVFLISNIGRYVLVWQQAEKLFSVDDWAYMAGISDEEVLREQSRYERIFSVVPPGLKLPGHTDPHA